MKRIAEILVLLVLVLTAGCLHTPRHVVSPQASQHVAAGVAALGADDLDRAEAEFHLALEFEPKMPQAMNGLGLVALARGDRDDARKWFAATVRVNGEFAEARANLGAVELEAGHAEAAIPHLRAALAIDPGYVPARHNLARALASLGRLSEARAEYMKLTSTARENGDAWAELAAVELGLGRRAAAGQHADFALEFAPGQRLARRVKADLKRDGGDPDGALADYGAILEEAPADVDALIGRGMALLLLGRPAEARRDLERATGIAPDNATAHFALGVASTELEDDAAAEQELLRAIELAHEAGRAYPEAEYLRARALARLGRHEDAVGAYQRFLHDADGDATLADAVTDARTQIASLSRGR